MKYCAVLFVPPYQRIGTILVLSLLRTLLLFIPFLSFSLGIVPRLFLLLLLLLLLPLSFSFIRPQRIEPGQGLQSPLSSAWLQKILCEIISASRYRPGIFYEMYNLAGCTTVSRNLPSFEATRKRDFLKGITAFLRFLWYSMVYIINEYIYNGIKNYQHNLYNLLFQNWVWKN